MKDHSLTRRPEYRRVMALLCVGVMVLAAFGAAAAPQRLADHAYIVAGQEADTPDFTLPAGRNRTVVVSVHARTDTGPTADYVTVDWARLNGDAGQPLTKARAATRNFDTVKWQGATMLYRHIEDGLTGDVSVRIRMSNNLTDDKVAHVLVLGSVDSTFNPVAGDTNGAHNVGVGTQMLAPSFSAPVDFIVVDAATHNAGGAGLTGAAPVGKTRRRQDNVAPSMTTFMGSYFSTGLAGGVFYTLNASDQWSILVVPFGAAYIIEASAGANGQIDPEGDVSVTSGANQAFTITADANYVIAEVLVDGAPVGDAPGEESYVYTFENVTTNHTISATFSGRPVITVDPDTIAMECGQTGYTEAMALDGVAANDPEDGDITADIIISNVSFPLLAPGVYDILYDVTDADGTPAVQKTRTVTIADTLKPEITLVGEAVVFIECGIDLYEELGADAVDQCDGVLAVTIGGDEVDAAVVDDYSITYNAGDAEGLDADEVVRAVHVVDTTGPVITLLAESNPLIIDGGGSYTEAGATAWDACDGEILAESIAIGGDEVNTGLIGTQHVTYTAVDSWGNANTETLSVVIQRVDCALMVNAVATDISVLPGEQVILQVALDVNSCAVGPVSYEWMKRNGGKSDDFSVIPDAPNGPLYTIASATEADSGVYRCDVSDEMYTVSSPEITLTVGTGLPVAHALGLALSALAAAAAGAMAVRKRK